MKLASLERIIKDANCIRPAVLFSIGLAVFLLLSSADLLKLSSDEHIQHSHNVRDRRLEDFTEKLNRGELDNDARGNASFVANKTIFGAIIMTDYNVDQVSRIIDHSNSTDEKLKASAKLSKRRSMHAREMISHLPFPVVHWPPVFTKACPFSESQHKSERGLLYAHYRIWLDFVYFDNELLHDFQNKKKTGISENYELVREWYFCCIRGWFIAQTWITIQR